MRLIFVHEVVRFIAIGIILNAGFIVIGLIEDVLIFARFSSEGEFLVIISLSC
jgi:hypothetical protein